MVKRLSSTDQNDSPLVNVPTPVSSGDAVNKSYADTKASASSVSNVDNTSDATKNIGGNAATVTTNANLTGAITSVGNATSIGANPYKFSVYRNATLNTGTSAIKIAFDTERYDTNNNFASGTYTVPVTGYYHFDAMAGISSVGGQEFWIAVYVNGSLHQYGNHIFGTSNPYTLTLSTDIYLTASNTVDIYCQVPVAPRGLRVGSTVSSFSGHLISIT